MSDAFHVVHVVLAVDVGGMERGLINQIREALRLGERVTVVCLERPGVLAPQLEALGVPVLCLHKKPGFRWGLVRRMAEVFRPLRPDVVHTHQPATMFYGVPAARRAGVPVIVHTQHGKFFAAERWRWRWLGWLAGRHLTRFFCLTQDIAREVTSHGIVPASKVEIIVNGIDTARFQGGDGAEELRESLRIPPAAPVVGTVARLTAIKRQDLLLSAFARVRERVPDAHLVLVGDGPLLGPLRGLAGDLGLAECVHFAGYQDRPERFYPLMDVFALTSESEGMPQSVMEAGAARVPVVASRVGGLA
jgi:glycosyltransferase involved in cell wall biosynthesis